MKTFKDRPVLNIFISGVLLLLFSFLLLTLGYCDYLKRLDELSIFLPTTMFFSECMHQPGGLLNWLGCWLTQYFYHPLFGAAIFSLLVVYAFALSVYSFRLKRGLWGLASMPAVMMLLWLVLPGYVIFSLRTSGYAYFGILGILTSVMLFCGYTHLKSALLRVIYLVVVIVGGYPSLGFYALLAGMLLCIFELKRRKVFGYIVAIVGLSLIFAYPYAYFIYMPTILTPSTIYLAGMPNIMPEEVSLWMPYIVSAVALVVLAAIDGLVVKYKWTSAINYGLVGVNLLAVLIFRYNDPNFMMSLRLQRAIEDGEWQKASEIAREIDFEPTRLNTLCTYIPLMRLGNAQEVMFTYPAGSAAYDSPRESNALRDAAGIMVSYHFGRPYNAYRWAMEYKVEYGLKVEYLKYLAKCALLNGEYDLARKYLHTLSLTKYHSEWANRYLAFADNPSLITDDAEFKQIIPLMLFKDHVGGDGGKIETYLLPVISALAGGTPELQNLSLICNLIQKDVDTFIKKYGNTAMRLQHIPRHYQEAILVWCMVHQSPAYKQFKMDPMVMRRFDQFMNSNRMYINRPKDEIQARMKEQFGDTYWYYYFFADDLKTN